SRARRASPLRAGMGAERGASLDRHPTEGADGSMGAAEPGQAGADRVPRRGSEVALADAADGVGDGLAPTVEVLLGHQELKPLLETGRGRAEREQDLAHLAVDEVLRVPEREVVGLETDWVAVRVEDVPEVQVVDDHLDVVEEGLEVIVVGGL